MTDGISVIDGTLSWTGSLIQDIPVNFSADIIFPEEGDWEVILYVSNPDQPAGVDEYVFVNVTQDEGRWGWAWAH